MNSTARSSASQPTPTLGYASVAPGEPLDGPAIEAQLVAIRSACERLNLRLIDVTRDHQPGGGRDRTPARLKQVLERIDSGEASCLIVTDTERLARRATQLETILDRLEKGHARLVVLELGLDSATEAGSLAMGPSAEPSAAEAPAGDATAQNSEALRKRIASMRADGMTLQTIADTLNEEGVRPQDGGTKWRPSSVRIAAHKRPAGRPG
jgi:DNA invertase Pin-like site-specific DNA recombinase